MQRHITIQKYKHMKDAPSSIESHRRLGFEQVCLKKQ
jgi:hypothetical protein